MCISNVVNIYHLNKNQDPSQYISSFINVPQPYLINDELLKYSISICCKHHDYPNADISPVIYYLNNYYKNYDIKDIFVEENMKHAKNPRVFFIDKQNNNSYYNIYNSLL